MKRIPKKFLFTSLLPILLTGCFGTRAVFTDPRLPQQVNDIWGDAQESGKEFQVFRSKVHAHYGKPGENSGAREQWTFDRGILTIDPVAGAFFVTGESEMIRLIRVRNPLKETLYGPYSMASLPTADYRHERFWMGDVDLRVNGTYVYRGNARRLLQRKDQSDNFFLLNPSGQFDVTYLNGFSSTTLVESIRSGQRIVKLTFRGCGGAERSYFIKAIGGLIWRQLGFEGDEMEFELESGIL